ncbi:MAG TPA: M23 family metallopeptidase [Gaiellaceae bacterium]|nr:M23 family metallopeptidase [Gaiellaceae bacterium]
MRLAGLTAAALLLPAALAAGAPPPAGAVTGASAVLLRVTVPGQAEISLGELSWPRSTSAEVQSFQYPDDGSVAVLGRSRASVSAQAGHASVARARAEVIALSLFGGDVVAGRVASSTTAGASARSAGATVSGSAVQGLRVLGADVPAGPGTTVPLGDWGTLTVLAQETGDRQARRSAAARGSVVGLRVRLSAEHGGLPAGSEIVVASAEATAAARFPASPPPPVQEPLEDNFRPTPPRPALPRAPEPETAGESVPGGPVRVPPEVTARLSAGGYVFPVHGPASFGDSFGAPRPNVPGGWHHGEDIFAPMGAPVLAVADGTLHTIGFTPIGGYRLWLRDRQGNQFYYAHLSAYSPLAVEGRSVRAGDVIGFVGDTGDAEGGTPHLHFEIHPAPMLGLGYDGVVAPYPILLAWRRAEDVSFAAGRVYVPAPRPGAAALPPPGAVLLRADDIAAASGLEPGALERALRR